MQIINRKRRQQGLRKMAAALRILEGEQIISLSGPIELVQPDGQIITFYREGREFKWAIDEVAPNADN